MNKVLSLNPVNAHRRYCLQLIDATPLTGGDPKIGDKMEGDGMIQKQDDYENFESYVYKPIFLDEVMKGKKVSLNRPQSNTKEQKRPVTSAAT